MSKCGFKNNSIPISGEREKKTCLFFLEKNFFFEAKSCFFPGKGFGRIDKVPENPIPEPNKSSAEKNK